MSLFTKSKNKLQPLEPCDDPTSLGNILLTEGYITEQQLHKALTATNGATNLKLGDRLIYLKYTTKQRIEMALMKQSVDRGEMSTSEALQATLSIQQRLRDKGNKTMRDVVTTLTTRNLSEIKRGV